MRTVKQTKIDVSKHSIELYDEVMESLNEIDYDKILDVMWLLDWKYYGVDVMNVNVLKNMAKTIIFKSLSKLIYHNKMNSDYKDCTISSGGFEAETIIDENGVIFYYIRFVIEDVERENK